MIAKIILHILIGLFVISMIFHWGLVALVIGLVLFIGFIFLFGLAADQGFRNKFPLDFLMCTGWLNNYFTQKGYDEFGYDLEDSDYPATVFSKGQTKVTVRLNAPLSGKEKYTISVIANGDVEKEWEFDVNADKEKTFETLDSFFLEKEED